MNKPLISVVINTYNRPEKIIECVQTLISQKINNYEILVVEQLGSNHLGKKIIKISPKIRYFNLKNRGASMAKNFAIKKALGKIIAFTDDDCIADKYWLENIKKTFSENKKVVGTFGKVKPYKANKHKDLICPCTFTSKKQKLITKPRVHWKYVGFGNNMAFRKLVFDKIGGFKEWLGPGSIGSNAEDAEFALRTLINGYTILYNPKSIIYHNRWLNQQEYLKQELSYICGEMACYGHLSLKSSNFAKIVVIDNLKDSFLDLKRTIKSLLLLEKKFPEKFMYFLKKIIARLKGFCVGFYFTKISLK